MNSGAEPFEISGKEILPGSRITLNLPIAQLYTHASVNMPIHVIRGKKDGPRLFVSAAIHGDEINGVEIIRRLLRQKSLANLRGCLIAIPIVNVYGFISRSRYLPDRRDLNRSFPGSSHGSLTSYLAHLFIQEIVSKCTHGIDLHTGARHRNNLPQIRASLEDEETAELARHFGTPVIVDANVRDGSLREAVSSMGIPMLLYEGGEPLRFNEFAIKTGLGGIINVMRKIGMLPKKKFTPKKHDPLIARSTTWLRAPKSGILFSRVSLGSRIDQGDTLGRIADPFGENELKVHSPLSGLIIGKRDLPLVHRGDALYHVASVKDPVSLEAMLEELRQELDEENIPPYPMNHPLD